MKAVVQRVRDASVSVIAADDGVGVVKGSISFGLLVYLGVANGDNTSDADWLAEKIVNLRIFDDSNGKMNLSLTEYVNQCQNKVNETDVNYRYQLVNEKVVNARQQLVNEKGISPVGILAVSQFTLLGDARKGRRPSWGKAAPPEKARELYLYFMEKVRESLPCESGEFQAHMMVTYTNDGPVTILLDSRENV